VCLTPFPSIAPLSSLELYHGRLDKKPLAIAMRIRWYGPSDPNVVYFERKTHHESWTGEESVKERFEIEAKNVMPFLLGTFKVRQRGFFFFVFGVEEMILGFCVRVSRLWLYK
jgi:hypothetical protein